MIYFQINGIDFSMYVNELDVSRKNNYSAQTNAEGNTIVDYINAKYSISVGIIPLDSAAMIALQEQIDNFNVSIRFLEPKSGELVELNCIIPDNQVRYYTIQDNKVLYNAFKIKFVEL